MKAGKQNNLEKGGSWGTNVCTKYPHQTNVRQQSHNIKSKL